ncbi:MAG: hypothetical protein QM758_10200 [Armatimonas sp.]
MTTEPDRLKTIQEAITKRQGQIDKARVLIADLEAKTRDLTVLR